MAITATICLISSGLSGLHNVKVRNASIVRGKAVYLAIDQYKWGKGVLELWMTRLKIPSLWLIVVTALRKKHRYCLRGWIKELS